MCWIRLEIARDELLGYATPADFTVEDFRPIGTGCRLQSLTPRR
jgi:hypothetical protein